MVINIRHSRSDEGGRLAAIWRRSVDVAHDFLSKAYRKELEEIVRTFLPEAPLWVVANTQGQSITLMLLTREHMDAPFADPDVYGCDAGKLLIEHTLPLTSKLTTDVNEQNEQTVGFYQRMGFNVTGRSEADDLGQPYPLLDLVHEQRAEADWG